MIGERGKVCESFSRMVENLLESDLAVPAHPVGDRTVVGVIRAEGTKRRLTLYHMYRNGIAGDEGLRGVLSTGVLTDVLHAGISLFRGYEATRALLRLALRCEMPDASLEGSLEICEGWSVVEVANPKDINWGDKNRFFISAGE